MDKQNIHFVADTHFSHSRIIEYENRPFANVEEMDETLINNWNSVVGKKDLVYHLGDFCLSNMEDCKKISRQLNGRKILIKGNHDHRKLFNKFVEEKVFSEVYQVLEVKLFDQIIWLSHYAHRVWPKSHYNSWALFGHSHSALPPYNLSFDVGVDCWNFTPINFLQVEEKMKEQEKEHSNYYNNLALKIVNEGKYWDFSKWM